MKMKAKTQTICAMVLYTLSVSGVPLNFFEGDWSSLKRFLQTFFVAHTWLEFYQFITTLRFYFIITPRSLFITDETTLNKN